MNGFKDVSLSSVKFECSSLYFARMLAKFKSMVSSGWLEYELIVSTLCECEGLKKCGRMGRTGYETQWKFVDKYFKRFESQFATRMSQEKSAKT